MKPAIERFWAKVDKTDTCWLWTGATSAKGYGRFTASTGCVKFAHRWIYEQVAGPLPAGLQVDHTCHVRRCVRPEHLQAVTQSQNMQNRRGANRQSMTGVRGVTYDARVRKYVAQVWAAAEMHRQYHSTLAEAEVAVIELRNRLMTNNLRDRRRAINMSSATGMAEQRKPLVAATAASNIEEA